MAFFLVAVMQTACVKKYQCNCDTTVVSINLQTSDTATTVQNATRELKSYSTHKAEQTCFENYASPAEEFTNGLSNKTITTTTCQVYY